MNQRDVWSRVLGLLVLGAGWVLALGSQNPPAPRGEDTPPEAFSAAELPTGPELGPLSEGEASVFRYWAPPAEGVELTLRFPAGTPLELRVVDQDYALPEGGLAPRRLEAMPAPEGAVILEGTRVSQSLSL
ncbi:hypothetical protein [Archangium sp.]|uniref:hypothetical protein n=1 Tax=Archangium sp. TaxID=1872627 RepID=UPI003899C7E2